MEVSKRDITVSIIAGLILVAVLVPSLVFVNNGDIDVTEENLLEFTTVGIMPRSVNEENENLTKENSISTEESKSSTEESEDSKEGTTKAESLTDKNENPTEKFEITTEDHVGTTEIETVFNVDNNVPTRASSEVSKPVKEERTSEKLDEDVDSSSASTESLDTTTFFEIRNPKVVQVSNLKFDLSQPEGETVSERVRRILSSVPLIDGHNDFPMSIREHLQNDISKLQFDSDLTKVEPWASDPVSHTDLLRLRKGQVGGQFWSAYMGCDSQYKDAVQLFLEQIDVIKQLVAKYPDDLQWSDTADGIEAAFQSGKIASLVGVESGHAIGNSIAVLRTLYDSGARYMTLTHSCNTPWADAAEAESGDFPAENKGISKFGEQVVLEMNRLGMMVDLAHVSSNTMRDVLHISKAPVIFSHSGARGVTDNVRNVPDDVLEIIKVKGGVVMANFYSCYIIDDCNKNNATVNDVVKHINYIREVAGVDHVGIGGDYNGVSKLPVGLEDVSGYPKVFKALINDKTFDWTDDDLEKLASRNLLGVMRAVESVRDSLAANNADNTWIDFQDLSGKTGCRS